MSDIALNQNRDLDVTGMALRLVVDTPSDQANGVQGDPAAIAQEIGIALMMFQSEWFLDVLRGFPWFEQVFVKNPNERVLVALFARYIRSVAGVLEVPSVELDFDTTARFASMDFEARAQDGGVIEDRLTDPLPRG